MTGYGEQFIKNMKEGGLEKAQAIALVSVQYYTDKLIDMMNNLPEKDIVFFLAAIKMLNNVTIEALPMESCLANGLTRLISSDVVVVSKASNGIQEITRIKRDPKR